MILPSCWKPEEEEGSAPRRYEEPFEENPSSAASHAAAAAVAVNASQTDKKTPFCNSASDYVMSQREEATPPAAVGVDSALLNCLVSLPFLNMFKAQHLSYCLFQGAANTGLNMLLDFNFKQSLVHCLFH